MTDCPHCHCSIEVRNASGKCDHLYWPEYCTTCKAMQKAERRRQRKEQANAN